MTQLIELIGKDSQTVIKTAYHIFEKPKKRWHVLRRDMGDIKKTHNMCLEIKAAISEMKNKLNGMRYHREKNNELEDTAVATSQNKILGEKKTKKKSTEHQQAMGQLQKAEYTGN